MSETSFYERAASYWANVPATIDGVLGGFGHMSDADLVASRDFLTHILNLDQPPNTNLALDCGAGIGRVTANLLIPHFDKVDLVEQDEKFVNTAKQFIGEGNDKLGTVYEIGLQHFQPQKKYDLIWCQWVLGHLNDDDLVDFLERCHQSLAENGVIVVKENISPDEVEFDEADFSVTRPLETMYKIFERAKLTIVEMSLQTDFPEDIYAVYAFALTPNKVYAK